MKQSKDIVKLIEKLQFFTKKKIILIETSYPNWDQKKGECLAKTDDGSYICRGRNYTYGDGFIIDYSPLQIQFFYCLPGVGVTKGMLLNSANKRISPQDLEKMGVNVTDIKELIGVVYRL